MINNKFNIKELQIVHIPFLRRTASLINYIWISQNKEESVKHVECIVYSYNLRTLSNIQISCPYILF